MPKIIKTGQRPRRRKGRAGFPIILILLLLVVVGSLLYAVILGKRMVDGGLVSDQPSQTASENVISDIELTSSAQPEPASSEEPQAEYGKPLPERKKVDATYFSDAVFFGDSVTDGIALYGVMANAKVIAHTNINPATALTSESIKTADGTKITMIDALKAEDPAKIYVMMGINSIGLEKVAFLNSYAKMLDAIVAQHPDAVIYLQAITPITASFESSSKNTYDITNARIREFNEGILSLAGEKKLYYVDTYAAIADENDALPDEASPKDGIHFGAKYYEKWFEYLKTHTAPD